MLEDLIQSTATAAPIYLIIFGEQVSESHVRMNMDSSSMWYDDDDNSHTQTHKKERVTL